MMDKFFFIGKSTPLLSGNMSQFFINNQPKRMTQTHVRSQTQAQAQAQAQAHAHAQAQAQNNYSNENKKKFITFIIPSIGRKSLLNTIDSIKNNTINDWQIIIVYDGVKEKDAPKIKYDERIMILYINKLGKSTNSAGLIRNIAMNISDSQWVGFVDDDDTISKDYIYCLKNEITQYPDINVVVFRMQYNDGRIIPPKNCTKLQVNKVGISFAINVDYYKTKKILFEPSSIEDWVFLEKIKNKNGLILISNSLCYFVRSEHTNRSFSNVSEKSVLWK